MTKNDDGIFAAAGCGIFILWLLGALFSLGLTGVIIWAIYEAVMKFVVNG